MTNAINNYFFIVFTSKKIPFFVRPSEVSIKTDAFEQSANWYKKGEDRLLICAIGGKDKVGAFFKSKVLRPIVDAGAFSRIALVLDRDEKEVGSVESHASSVLKSVVTTMRNNEWISNSHKDAYDMEQGIDALLVIIPTEHQGAADRKVA